MEDKKETSCLEFILQYLMGAFVAIGAMGGIIFLLEKAGYVVIK